MILLFKMEHNGVLVNGVAQHFDEHVRQSIPLYDEGHDLVCHLSDFFIRDHSLCYELGSATGNLIGKLYQRHKSKKEVRFIGIEEIPENGIRWHNQNFLSLNL